MDIISFIFGFITAIVIIGCVIIAFFLKIIVSYTKKIQEQQALQQKQTKKPSKISIL